MLSQSGERTFISTILPLNTAHINTCISICFSNTFHMLSLFSCGISVPFDFYVKSTGMGHANQNVLNQFPVLNSITQQGTFIRALALTSINSLYSNLWALAWQDAYRNEVWAKDDPRLPNSFFKNLTSVWNKNCALRTDYARRQALVEIDVLVAKALGLTLEELITIYRVQFPVMRQYESETWYDQNGRIVFTASKGLPGVGFSRSKWNEVKDMKTGIASRAIIDNTLGESIEKTIEYLAPFDRCDREGDYRMVWRICCESSLLDS